MTRRRADSGALVEKWKAELVDVSMVEGILKGRRTTLTRLQIENQTLDRQIAQHVEKVKSRVSQLEMGQEALQFLENVANSRRGAMKAQIENVVTEALSFIYGDTYRIELVYDVKNNRSFMEIELVKETPQGPVRRQMDGFGGGVSDTISVPLRLLVLLASRQTDPVCILDECYKHMDLTRVDRVAEFMCDVSHRLALQVIMLSHHVAMHEVADSAWHVTDKDGTSVVRMIDVSEFIDEEGEATKRDGEN